MQTTSALYNTIISDNNHWFETQLVIDGVGTFDETKLFSISTRVEMFESTPTIGKAIAGEINIEMLNPAVDVPQMAKLEPKVRVCRDYQEEIDGEIVVTRQNSEWLSQGVYYIDTRERTRNIDGLSVLSIHGYDDMLRAEQQYPSTAHEWPYADISVVNEIAAAMGVEVDSRTTAIVNKGYMISLPAGYTMREVLGYIASMYVGSFLMTEEGKLRLISLLELPPETNLLIDQLGDRIVFGEDRILV